MFSKFAAKLIKKNDIHKSVYTFYEFFLYICPKSCNFAADYEILHLIYSICDSDGGMPSPVARGAT